MSSNNIRFPHFLSRLRRSGLEASPGGPRQGNIDHIRNGVIEGWVKDRNADEALEIDIRLGEVVLKSGQRANRYRQDVEEAGIGTGAFGFSCSVPADLMPTVVGRRIEVRLTSSGELLLSKMVLEGMIQTAGNTLPAASAQPLLPVPAHGLPPALGKAPAKLVAPKMKCDGRIESLTSTSIRGWAVDTERPGKLFELGVLVNGIFLTRVRNDQRRGDLLRHGKSDGLGGFELRLFLGEMEPGSHHVTVVLPDGKTLTQVVTTDGTIRRYPLNAGLTRIDPADTAIIVPIYNAADDVDICIRRLRQFTPQETEILLIDDASPDPRISRLLQGDLGHPGMRVLRNTQNLGFTPTINRGLEEIGSKHAILLNSDARVTPDWFSGMLRAAGSRPRVATVTAMSDRAGAFSAPMIGNDNTLPPGVDEITYARAFRSRALGLYPVVPTGNGFCMFVNRACLNEIGPLDAEAFPRGYGEENDFCMRAGRAGWSHVIDDRTYVFHDRSKSFGEAKNDLMQAGRRIVDERFPEYKTAIRVFSSGPEITMARYRAAQAMDDCTRANAGLPCVLFVVATQTGGTPQTNMDLMVELADEMSPWLLFCDSNQMSLSRLDGGTLTEIRTYFLSEPVDPLTHRSGEYDAVMRDWLEIVNPQIVHIRHLAWHSLSLPELARARGSRVVFSFHDFYTLCPTVKLMDERNVFCGGTCTATEGECTIELWQQIGMPKIKDSWVHVWRERFRQVLRDCDAYVTTSQSARQRIQSALDLDPDRFFVIPHGRSFSRMHQLREHPQHGEPVRILVPGNISTPKGRDIITALLAHDSGRLLEFHILGKVSQPEQLAGIRGLIQHGAYARDDFANRVAKIRPHLGAVFSIWDETYCHTLTELWSSGVPALVFDFPTVAERTRGSGAGWVVPHEDIAALYDRILAISFDEQEQNRADLAVLHWQTGNGTGRTTKVMSASYRDVYRFATGRKDKRPLIAVVAPASPHLNRANASTEIRTWERTVNGPDRDCLFVRMTPQALQANVRGGMVDGVILQRDVVPATMVAMLMDDMRAAGLRYMLDLDDDLFDVPADKDPTGSYSAYAPSLQKLAAGAALVTVATEPLRKKLAQRNIPAKVMPNMLSERLWRGAVPVRQPDGKLRALYMGSFTHRQDLDLIAPALQAIAEADPDFRLAIIGVHDGKLPDWAERIPVPDAARSYASFVPWLKKQAEHIDFAFAPLADTTFNRFKSDLKARDCGALGLPVLASDMPVYRDLARRMPGLELVSNDTDAWRKAAARTIEAVRNGGIDRAQIRDWVMRECGLAPTLPSFDRLLVELSRSTPTAAPDLDGAAMPRDRAAESAA